MQALKPLPAPRHGWEQGRWASLFGLYLLPGLAAAFTLTALIEGRPPTSASPALWAFTVPASFASLWWAGLRDGPEGWLGRRAWGFTLVLATVWAWMDVQRAIREKHAGPDWDGFSPLNFVYRINLAGYQWRACWTVERVLEHDPQGAVRDPRQTRVTDWEILPQAPAH